MKKWCFCFRYRPYTNATGTEENRPSRQWSVINDIPGTEYTINDLAYGEHYEFEVDSVAHQITSRQPLQISQMIVPQAVANIEPTQEAIITSNGIASQNKLLD